MKCEAPYQKRLGKHHEFWQEFPCGRCLSCRINRAEEWSFRIRLELEDRRNDGDFLTMTFDDNKCTAEQRTFLDKREVQLFVKRLRKGGLQFRYFACGEYGEKHERAHYHMIIIRKAHSIPFGKEIEHYQKYWPFGSVHVGTVTSASARYVTGYLTKSNAIPPGRESAPPFQLQSQGFGKDWVLKHPDWKTVAKENNEWIPKYFRDLIPNLPQIGDLTRKNSLELLMLYANGNVKTLKTTSQPEQLMHRRGMAKKRQEGKRGV